MYSRALRASEVAAIFATGSNGMSPLGYNSAPVVEAGADIDLAHPGNPVQLACVTNDDGAGGTGTVTCTWSLVSGPGNVTFSPVQGHETTALFDALGTYVI